MARVTPTEFREKQARRLKAALPDMQTGIERVSEAPGKKAAAKQDKMLANLTASINSGKWAKKVSSVSLSDWKNKAIQKGLPRVSAGIDAAAAKVEAFAAKLLPHVDAGVAKVNQMSDVTLEDSIARMTAFTRHMADFKG